MSLSLNDEAVKIVERMIARADELQITHTRLDDGSLLVDCGADARGGIEAGIGYAKVCMGGLGHLSLGPTFVGDRSALGISVRTDHPAAACLASQYAGRKLEGEGFFAMASGPGRALIGGEPIFDDLRWEERSDVAVLCLETGQVPPADVRARLAERAGVAPSALTFLIAPTASLVGSVQIGARVVETALHKLHELGFDPHRVISASGSCPLPPVARNDAKGIGRTNDAILYGGAVQLVIDAPDDEIAELAPRLPSSASPAYGEPFGDILERANWDFYAIDPLLFSPAEVAISSTVSGRTHHAGAIAHDIVARSLWG